MKCVRRLTCAVLTAGMAIPVLPHLAFAQATSPSTKRAGLEEIVVTATRREVSEADVPISVTAYTGEKLDLDNVRSAADIMRMTPGVQFNQSNTRGGNATISIRGISSTAGTSTTGVYLNDTPIQTRQAGNLTGNSVWPAIFDLERVEVLRGPQGTLFGAGSEGGTVRFITPAPNSNQFDAYARVDLASTAGGAPTAGGGAAANIPVISDKLGIRLSGSVRHDGGYVDRINGTTGFVLAENENSIDTQTFRIAAAYTPSDTLTVTPSFYWQKQSYNGSSNFELQHSDASDGVFRQSGFMTEGSKDDFSLYALKVEWNGPAFSVISNTSYFDRHQFSVGDLIRFEASIWGNLTAVPDGFYAPDTVHVQQDVWTQEVRLQSNDTDSRLSWQTGIFYQNAKQNILERAQDTFLPTLWVMGGNPGTFEQAFGMGLTDGLYTVVVGPWRTVDEQLALFGEVDYQITPKLKATLGVRAAKTRVLTDITYDGPIVGGFFQNKAEDNESPVTPKFGLSYNVTDGTMAYLTVAKGYRTGGGNNPVPINCGATTGSTPVPGTDLGNLGLTDRPDTYESDSLWSYELGSKTRTAGGRLAVDASVYLVKWKNIISTAVLPLCGFDFRTNAGSATSRGFDLSVQAQPVDALTLGVDLGYTKATYDHTVYLDPQGTNDLHTGGTRIWAHPWTLSFHGQVSFPVMNHDGYFRVNYTWQSKLDSGLPSFDPNSSAYDPTLPGIPEIQSLRLRLGAQVNGVDVALYVNNATNEHPFIGYGHIPGTTRFASGTLRPRTIGLTMSYRY